MATETKRIHVFIVSFPVQGQINPLLRLGKRLASMGGFLVTIATTAHFGRKMIIATGISPDQLFPVGRGFLRFDFFGEEETDIKDHNLLLHHLNRVGREGVDLMLRQLADEGRPVSCLINGNLVPWVYDVGTELNIPVATLWTQSCACFLSFFYCNENLVPFPTKDDLHIDVEIPTLPLLKWDDLHSFLHPTSTKLYQTKSWLAEFDNLNKPFCILMDTFDDLEHETIQFSSELFPIIKPVGPLLKDPIAPTSALIRGDHLKPDFDCLRWLDSKPRSSVVYISFGSLAYLKQVQIDEIAYGLLNVEASFLWVLKPPLPNRDLNPHTLPEGFLEKVADNGMIVEFCPQDEVLAHMSIACFVTHCGWNSTMEGLTSGVPMVAFPLWGDQLTDAKFLVDVYGVAVRMGRGEHEDRVVPREEVEKCIREATVGSKAEEMKKNALVWKEKAHMAYQEGGSSYRNLLSFVYDIRKRSGAVKRSL